MTESQRAMSAARGVVAGVFQNSETAGMALNVSVFSALALDGVPEARRPEEATAAARDAKARDDGPLLSYRNATSENVSKSEQVKLSKLRAINRDVDRGEKTKGHDGPLFSEREVKRLRAINRAPEAVRGAP